MVSFVLHFISFFLFPLQSKKATFDRYNYKKLRKNNKKTERKEKKKYEAALQNKFLVAYKCMKSILSYKFFFYDVVWCFERRK